MRTLLLTVAVGTLIGGCATVSRTGGASGAEVVSGETKPEAAYTGATTNQVATNGSDNSDTGGASVAPR